MNCVGRGTGRSCWSCVYFHSSIPPPNSSGECKQQHQWGSDGNTRAVNSGNSHWQRVRPRKIIDRTDLMLCDLGNGKLFAARATLAGTHDIHIAVSFLHCSYSVFSSQPAVDPRGEILAVCIVIGGTDSPRYTSGLLLACKVLKDTPADLETGGTAHPSHHQWHSSSL